MPVLHYVTHPQVQVDAKIPVPEWEGARQIVHGWRPIDRPAQP
ncbi:MULTISPECIES: hypothetical protein [unclassified Mesorhizobium]|nr:MULTISPECIES: hypothetical protein [unclassified Mesorhizobium]